MKYEKILIRFGELSLKGNNKMTFVRKLASNISKICNVDLKHIDIMIDRIFIPYSIENLNNLNYVFGISSYSPVFQLNSNLDEIEKLIQKIDFAPHKNFKINSRRKWKDFPLSSLDLNIHLGNFVLKNNKHLTVKVKDPDIEVNIEIHKNFSYIFWEKIKGLGGLPVGVSGKTIHLLSGGIDSPVAALEMIKRGVQVDFLAFISPPHTDETTIKKLKLIVDLITKYQIKSTLYLFNYTEIMNYIGLTSNQKYKIVLMRRSFYRIASSIALKTHCLGISNGENLAQVASQTMEAIHVIHNQSLLPVYQPLLTLDKIEIISKSEKFNLFPISTIKACETCELFAPNHPATKPSIDVAQALEEELDLLQGLEEKAINNNIERLFFKINSKIDIK
ncbi:tRNA uracil 4-sulfurtransferase ThiI [Metamycoplasma sualvi]|uniref:tRNA uracil 4-sulfurtransferase ThiI n=1 Tax=Metamycoplasma sualvi TaxID=2125 RepID=UPI0038730494